MTALAGLREHIPDSCRDLLEMSDQQLKSKILELTRDKGRISDIEQVVKSFPSHHDLHHGDTRDLSMIDDESGHLAVTSPPYFNLKGYNIENGGGSEWQLSDIDDYERFNELVDQVWANVYEKLIPGGRLCVVVGDVLRSRSDHGRHRVLPLHATIQEHTTEIGYDKLSPIIWYKIGNASLEAGGNVRFLGKP